MLSNLFTAEQKKLVINCASAEQLKALFQCDDSRSPMALLINLTTEGTLDAFFNQITSDGIRNILKVIDAESLFDLKSDDLVRLSKIEGLKNIVGKNCLFSTFRKRACFDLDRVYDALGLSNNSH